MTVPVFDMAMSFVIEKSLSPEKPGNVYSKLCRNPVFVLHFESRTLQCGGAVLTYTFTPTPCTGAPSTIAKRTSSWSRPPPPTSCASGSPCTTGESCHVTYSGPIRLALLAPAHAAQLPCRKRDYSVNWTASPSPAVCSCRKNVDTFARAFVWRQPNVPDSQTTHTKAGETRVWCNSDWHKDIRQTSVKPDSIWPTILSGLGEDPD